MLDLNKYHLLERRIDIHNLENYVKDSFKEKYGNKYSVDIEIEKNHPHEFCIVVKGSKDNPELKKFFRMLTDYLVNNDLPVHLHHWASS
ncbi:MAG: hypothetical protein ACE5KE_10605 [Methanosarcinales archaeon]